MKTIIAVFGIVIIAGGAYYWYANQNITPAPVVEVTPTPKAVVTEPSGPNSGPSTLPTGAQSSNEALTQDLASIDSQLSGLSTDTTNASKSLSDQQVAQSSL